MSPGDQRGRPLRTASDKSIGPATDLNRAPAYAQTGLEMATENSAADWWTRGARLALRHLAGRGRPFDADELLELVGQPTDPHYVGVVFAAAQRSRLIEPIGSRVASDGRLLRIWWPLPKAMENAS